jgi:hypothetical protein
MRAYTWQAAQWRVYRSIVDTDAMRDPHIRTQLQPAPYNCPPNVFASDDPAAGLPHVYRQGVTVSNWVDAHGNPQNKRINDLWTRLFNSYRGFHGHGYSGANIRDDHNCPGARFDWHRFARDVWDYWWYPFDLSQGAPGAAITSGAARRDYGETDGVLYEHYYDEDASLFGQITQSGFFLAGEENVSPHSLHTPNSGPLMSMMRVLMRYWGHWHGGMHFQVDAVSPIYSMAAGQLVAARLSLPDEEVESELDRDDRASVHPSARFVLLRHEVFFQRRAGGDRIDYDQEPKRVYTLYTHLGAPPGLNTSEAAAGNPMWLNRLLAMKKEYDLGIAFHAAHPNPAAQWAPHVARWNRRQAAIDQSLADLEAGRVAVFPEGEDAIRVSLGDFIGVAGHLAQNAFGLHLEVFSRDEIVDPWFERVDHAASAARPFYEESHLDDVTSFLRGHPVSAARRSEATLDHRFLPPAQKATRFHNIARRSKSEWALEERDFPDGGWAAARDLMWWADVVPVMNAALAAEPLAQLPADAVVWHYHPLGFLAWLNELTWKSEWPKYRVKDAAGAAVPVPARPPPRR